MTARSNNEAEVDRRLAELERGVAARPSPALGSPAPGGSGAARPVDPVTPERGTGESRLGWRFLIGLLLVGFGAWGVLGNVTVTSGFGGLFGAFLNPSVGLGFGWLFVPIVAGIALVVARSGFAAKVGWLLIVAGFLFMFAQVLSSMRFFFRPVELPILFLMFAPIGVGLGLMLSDLLRSRAR